MVSCTRIYTQGLRDTDVLRASGTHMDWQRVLFHRLRLEHRKLGRGPTTAAAEDGLQIDPSAYWYIGRLEPDYAYIVTLSIDALEPGAQGVVCPFDTGGLWHDKLTLVAPLTPTQKRQFLADNSYSMDNYHAAMQSWLESAFEVNEHVASYSRGAKPSAHSIPDIVIDDDTRSWTWEVRVAVKAATDSLPPATSLHMTEQQYDQYETWLTRLREISTFEVYDHLEFVESIVSVSANPYEDATQLLVAQASTGPRQVPN